ncbi:MAG: zinc-binding dehydrogenase [Actinomycetota bacterium]
MRAFVVSRPGGPEVLELGEVPRPVDEPGRVRIGIEAFGLNRAEAVTRAGGSGDAVPFPRVIGIECVGRVLDAGGTGLTVGQTVAAAMGGMGRAYDGSYAEETSVPRSNVFPLDTTLAWEVLGAVPETFFTAWGSVQVAGGSGRGVRMLVRPGASALGLAIAQIVVADGGEVIGVTRSASKRDRLIERGFTEVLVADGPVVAAVRDRWPGGATGVVDTIASDVSLADDLDLLADGGRICVSGSLADSYGTGETATVGGYFARDDVGFYSSEELDAAHDTATLQAVVDRVADGTYAAGIDEVIAFEDLPAAHERMEANAYAGKVVVRM